MTLTCISCRTTFSSSEDQRIHYKSEFHRFNLKRKVAGLPPVTPEAFEEKLSAVRDAEQQQQQSKVQLNTYCPYCEKSYGSQKAYENHCVSKKHLEKKAAAGDQDETVHSKSTRNKESLSKQPQNEGQIDSLSEEKEKNQEKEEVFDEEKFVEEQIKKGVELPLEQCMFCNEKHSDFEENLEHMTKEHGLFIPDLEFVTDLTGLVKYLSQKISFGFTCLYCKTGKVYSRMEAVQAHMRDLCHCKIRFETEEEQEEYDEFYDYSQSSSKDGEISSSTVLESYEKMQQHKSGLEDENAFNFTLPSGKVIGHRSLALYYKQTPRPNENREPLVVSKLLSQYQTLGWVSKPDVQHLVIKRERQIRRMENKYHSQLGIKANKLQHHFRCQTPL